MALSMSSTICSFLGFVFVIVVSPKYALGWFWIDVGLTLSICLSNGNKRGEGRGDGGASKFV